MQTMTKPDMMNPKQHDSHAGFSNVRVSALPAPSYWHPYPGLF
ncbi:hypothetical protein [Archangium sp.]|nr:hypothetical protein [Archangium sp.]HYO58457.1 hypothetical protein [Archangium sp.]